MATGALFLVCALLGKSSEKNKVKKAFRLRFLSDFYLFIYFYQCSDFRDKIGICCLSVTAHLYETCQSNRFTGRGTGLVVILSQVEVDYFG